MMVVVAIGYISIAFLFILMGYITTSRERLKLPLFVLASVLWPLSMVGLIAYVCAERLGLIRRSAPSIGWLPTGAQAAPGPARAEADRELVQPVAEQAGKSL